MAVYQRTYKGYSGALTPTRGRFLILARYSYARMLQSKFLVVFIGACLFYPLLCMLYIYISHSPSFLTLLRVPGGRLPPVDGRFFYLFSYLQGALAYLLTAFVGPSLMSWDLANGALPLYFCRPLSRLEYVAGKMTVLLPLLSLITWIPGLLLFAIEASLQGWTWTKANFWIAPAIFAALAVWIVATSLIGLALSALVKWRIAAGALVLGVYFAGAGFGVAINSVMRTSYGGLIDLSQIIHTIWSYLYRYDSGIEMPLLSAWVALGIVCAACVWQLARRIRAFEIVK